MLNRILNWPLVAYASFLCGLTSYLPIGMAYLSTLLLLIALAIHRNDKEPVQLGHRWTQLRSHLLFWPLCGFLGWSLLVALLLPHFKETGNELFHIVRIGLTIAVVLMLRLTEVRAALVGWVVGAIVSLLIIYLNQLIALPHVVGLRDLLTMYGNKSIGIAITLAIFSCSGLMYALAYKAPRAQKLWALAVVLVVPVLIWWLPSRTSLIIVLVCILVGLVHRLWAKPLLLCSSAFTLLLLGYAVFQTPQVQTRFQQGWQEMQTRSRGDTKINADLGGSSWGIRYVLYSYTAAMVADKPLTGWGIGSWLDQWQKRTPPTLHFANNMTHNDFLWMGAQTGIPGIVALASVIAALIWSVVRLKTPAASASVVASVGLLLAMSFNSALRDAQIGMSLLFVVMALNVFAIAQQQEISKSV
jgi:O-antigen ligase